MIDPASTARGQETDIFFGIDLRVRAFSARRVAIALSLAAATVAGATEVSGQTTLARDAKDTPTILTAQTRKMGGVMPADEMALEVAHIDLATRVHPDQKRIESVATLTLRASRDVPVILLDLYPGFAIAEIAIDGQQLPAGAWSNSEGLLRIARRVRGGATAKVRITYAGKPPVARRPPWEGGTTWGRTPDGRAPWIDTSLWGGGCDMLYPCIDHPTRRAGTIDEHYTVPDGLVAPGNGRFAGKQTKDGWTTWNWHGRDVHTYGPVLDVGPYKILQGRYRSRFGNTIPLMFFYLPGEEAQATRLFREFPRTLRFWEDVIGPYPWADEKMGVVRVPFSGLENNTMIGYSNQYPKTPYGWDFLLNHEFAHEWFANQLSVANYDDLWLHEGLGSYAQPLLAEYVGGDLDYFAQLKSQRAGIRNEQPLVTGRERTEKEVYADPTGPRGDIYTKGSWVAHTLRRLIGDEAFFRSLRLLIYGRDDPWPGNFAPRFGTTQDLLGIVNRVTGRDYRWFFDVYLYRAALPRLDEVRDGGMLRLHWTVPDGLPFPMPVDVRIGDRVVTLPMADGTGEVPVGPDSIVVVDPHSKILRASAAIDEFQAWQAATGASATRRSP